MNKLLSIFQNLILISSYVSKNNLNEKKLILDTGLESGVIFDIGSNLGSYIEFVNRTLKTTLEFHSFEPLPELCTLQQKKFSKLTVKVNNFGIDNKSGEFTFYRNSINSQSSFKYNIKNPVGRITKEEKFKVTTIDSYCEENDIKYIDILKIDTEGTEYEVLQSAQNMMKNNMINLIKLEITNEIGSFGPIFELLEDHNYELLGFCNQKFIKNKIRFVDAYFRRIT
jgi:FkbM family methyltransferase